MCRRRHPFKKFRHGARKRLLRLQPKHSSKFGTQRFVVKAKSFQIMPQMLAKGLHQCKFAAGLFQIFTGKKRADLKLRTR